MPSLVALTGTFTCCFYTPSCTLHITFDDTGNAALLTSDTKVKVQNIKYLLINNNV